MDQGRLRRSYQILVLATLAVAFAAWIRWWAASGFPLEGKICESTNPEYNCDSFDVIRYSAWRLASTLDHWSALIAAFATIFIGLFTYTLKTSTDKLFVATKESVDVSKRALIDLERAYIYVEKITSDTHVYLGSNNAWSDGTHWPVFTLSIINFGRTSGNIEFAAILFQVGEEMPAEITRLLIMYANPATESVEIIIGPNRPHSFPRACCTHEFTHAHASAIANDTSFLYCHGLITYIDIFANRHSIKFCRRYNFRTGEWPPVGGLERNSSDLGPGEPQPT